MSPHKSDSHQDGFTTSIGMENSTATQPASDRRDLSHQRFDIVAKDAIYTFPDDMLGFLMRGSNIEFLEHLESEFTTVETPDG